tara:strand:- start:1793 stop:2215 length:423 start_codon:yes stop_codon:yes gene_type:complete
LARRIPLNFGKSEDLKCLEGIENFEIPTADGLTEVCFAAKVSTQSFFIPWRVYVDDYVFAIDGSESGYYNTNESTINSLQSIEKLPTPLPKYQIQGFELIWGNAAWILVAYFIVAYIIEIIKDQREEVNQEETTPQEKAK